MLTSWTSFISLSAVSWLVGISILASVVSTIGKKLRGHRYDVVNPSPLWDVFGIMSMIDYLKHGQSRIVEGFAQFPGKPFILNTDVRPKIILSPEYIDAVNAEPDLDFLDFIKIEFLTHLPSFKLFDPPGHLVEDMVRTKLTTNLAKFTIPISEESTLAFDELWGASSTWQERVLKPDMTTLISRLSAVIFTGGELVHDKEWQKTTIDVTLNGFLGVMECRSFPSFLQPLVSLFMPHAVMARKNIRKGEELVGKIIARRRKEKLDAAQSGTAAPVYSDAISWLEEMFATGKYPAYNPATIQLSLAMAAIHTSTDLLTQTIYHICERPEIIEPLREEIRSVIGSMGWVKQALFELRLLDSFLKETQRLQSSGTLVMNRLANADVELPGNVKIKKGEQLAISTHWMRDPQFYHTPEDFDPYRFQKRRDDPKLSSKSHLVSTSVDHTGFSHGKHACPGRFFASNEIKIALVHMLLKYDFELVEKGMPPMIRVGTFASINSTAKLRIRRRKEEIAL